MPRFFNTAGPCRAEDHYMLPPERRVGELRKLIDEKLYFIVHAPRQVGKTTSLQALAEELTAEGRYTALMTSCEVGQKLVPNLEGSMAGILSNLRQQADIYLPEPLRPPPVDNEEPPESRLRDLLQRWAQCSPRPVVLFLDEIDALQDDVLISVLRQLRAGYGSRPLSFPQCIALIGLRDVRDYKVFARDGQQSLGTASPFKVKSDSLRLRNFTAGEVAELYGQHTHDTGQAFTPEAMAHTFELTRGQPWLVNALARQLIETLVKDRTHTIERADVDRAAEILIERRDTHLDSLIDKLREPRVQRVIAPILAGELILGDRIDDDLAYVEDLGLVERRRGGHLQIANPIYHEVIPRALASVTQYTIYHETAWYVGQDGRLDMPKLLRGFIDFWRLHGEPMLGSQPYHEVAAQLVLMSFLQRIVNGGGKIDREYAVGRGRLDLCVRWPTPTGEQREALELKVWRDGMSDPTARGLDQLGEYLDRLGLREGTLVIFDQRAAAAPIAQRGELSELEHGGRRIGLLRL